MNEEEMERMGLPLVNMRPLGQPIEIEIRGAAPATASQILQQLPQILHMMESSMPASQVVHSLHAQALKEPELRNLHAMQRFSEAGVNQLHAMVAAAGFVRRILAGDELQAMLDGLQEQLQVMQRSHAEAQSALTQIMGAEAARRTEAVQVLGQVMQIADRSFRSLMTVVQPFMTVEEPAGAVRPEAGAQ